LHLISSLICLGKLILVKYEFLTFFILKIALYTVVDMFRDLVVIY
jgi:hypothetical protein